VNNIIEFKKQYTSSLDKIYANLDRIVEFQKTGILRPITLNFSPTNKCNLNCSFCSVKNRDKTQEMPLDQAIENLDFFAARGIKTLKFTGGGEPTIWRYFNQMVFYCKEKYPEIGLGLITNGVSLCSLDDLNCSLWGCFDWIRISLNALDVNVPLQLPIIPQHVVISYSYVYNKGTTDDVVNRLIEFIERNKRYTVLKIQMDVFDDTLEFSPYFKQMLEQYKPDYFINKKETPYIPKRCFMGWIKPCLEPDGYIYRCSNCALVEQKYDDRYRIGSLYPFEDEIPLQPDVEKFDTSICHYCFFSQQNDFIDQAYQNKNLKHGRFI